ncbi:MAG TPA: bifunctional pyr operon transcriptional regulator/uracil phosphoribosyltransferase PyrR [Candidatus Limnocylindrales bacterium]|nr:bifunctional pyr operon transcriptional regulator/uracil phosphoribosyltransferase PyrR [Candidatus Limnocylindrales bacterium]
MAEDKQTLLERDDIGRMVSRMAHEIVEKASSPAELVLIGIRSRGVHLARRIARKIDSINKSAPAVGVIDVTPYRDDKSDPPSAPVGAFEAPVTVDERTVVLIDDVIFRGRTIRAAMEAVERLGQPKRILVAALIDRGARELPIRADIVGKNIDVLDGQRVNVLLDEADGVDQVVLTNWHGRNSV